MKNKKTTWLAGIGLLGLGTVLLSAGQAEEPKYKRYEVIRSVGGEVQTFDTIVDALSGFTAENYLTYLGFSADKDIRIMELPHTHETMMMHHHQMPCHDSIRVVKIDVPGDHVNSADAHHRMIIEKEMRVVTLDSLEGELVEVQRVMELVRADSLINLHLSGLHDSMIVKHEIVIGHDPETIRNISATDQQLIEMEIIHGEPIFEHHGEHGGHKTDLMVFGDGEKDFTLVIVSDAGNGSKQPVQVGQSAVNDGSSFVLYPNPASKEVAVQLRFDEKALTVVTVSDAQGKVVAHYDLGIFSGEHNQVIDVSKWSKGIYFVHVAHADERMVEKLVIE